MMKKLLSKFHIDLETRDGVITSTSLLGILINLLIAAVKVVIGVLAASSAIMTEGVNNATDALSSVMALVGAKLAAKHPDARHPFGYGRIEYLTSLVISAVILFSGFEMLKNAVKEIITPSALQISYLTLMIVGVSAVIKFFLGIYTIKMGKKVDSGSLVGVGLECRNDSFVSVLTIVSSLIFLIFHVNVDAYCAIITSLIILKAGFEVLRDTIGELLGRPGKKELADIIYKEVRSTEGVLNAADLMLHNYGPESYSGSVNVEIDHNANVGQVYQTLHELQLRIMHEHNVVMVFGIYAVNQDHPLIKQIRRYISDFVVSNSHIISYHALYLDQSTQKIYVDFVVDYALKDWDGLEQTFKAYMLEQYPNNEIELTIETQFV